jgi:hypothetical protein
MGCGVGAPQHSVDKLTDAHSDLWQTAPATMGESFSKWRQIARFESKLGDPGAREPAEMITQMLDELQAINGRWCEQ